MIRFEELIADVKELSQKKFVSQNSLISLHLVIRNRKWSARRFFPAHACCQPVSNSTRGAHGERSKSKLCSNAWHGTHEMANHGILLCKWCATWGKPQDAELGTQEMWHRHLRLLQIWFGSFRDLNIALPSSKGELTWKLKGRISKLYMYNFQIFMYYLKH